MQLPVFDRVPAGFLCVGQRLATTEPAIIMEPGHHTFEWQALMCNTEARDDPSVKAGSKLEATEESTAFDS